jgi:acyl-coenzyme A synthetase/AMP-(fatty) acid ligase
MSPATPETPCLTLDQLIRRRAKTHSDKALLTYVSASEEDDIVRITGADLERWTSVAAGKYDSLLKGDAKTSANRVVAIVGVSNLEYYLTFLAIQRLGYSTMLVSPRLADQGYIHLLSETGCGLVIASGGSRDVVLRVRPSLDTPVELISMVGVAQLQSGEQHDMAPLEVDDVSQSPELIVHSGGTTGLPKPVHLRSGRYLVQLSAAPSAGAPDQLSTLPLFHTFGLVTLFSNLIQGTQLSLLDADRPITVSAISRGLDRTGSKMLVVVPYILKFFAETQGGIDRLVQLRQVMTAGSAMPDRLVDQLLDAGVKMSQFYGQTECGVLMVPSADQWNWLTPLPFTAPYLKFEPVEDGLYHLVILAGLQSKVLSDRPDGSYGTRDLFHPHPTDRSKWKFAARYDDIIVLLNGEK